MPTLIPTPTSIVRALSKKLCQVRYDHQRVDWQFLSCQHLYQKKTSRSIDARELDEVPVHITPTTLLFLYLRPQQTAPQQFVPVWPDYSELSISKLLDDLREVLIPRGDVPPKRTLMIQVVR